MRELLNEILESAKKNKLRTFLTGFSVAWGIFMLVILLGSGNGLEHGIIANFGDMATNLIEVQGGTTSMAYAGYEKGRKIKLRNDDSDLIDQYSAIDRIAVVGEYGNKRINYGKEFYSVTVTGASPKTLKMFGIELQKGRFITETDLINQRKSIVLDENTAKILFHTEEPIGKYVNIEDIKFKVIGIVKPGNTTSTESYIPISTGQIIYKAGNTEMDLLSFTINGIESNKEFEQFENQIKHQFASKHSFNPQDNSAIRILNHMQQYKNIMLIFKGLRIFIWMIGIGTLTAGIVGVSNIMLVTVRERTPEFGIRKTFGAKPSSIIKLILLESICITASFGYIGMFLGVLVMEGVNYMVEYFASHSTSTSILTNSITIFQDPTLDLSITVSATIVLIIAGLIAGYIPAKRAARLKTIDALRFNK